ncbi:MAG: cytochrome c oxidase assembly protein [Sphingobium sp.]
MRRGALLAGALLAPLGWLLAAGGLGMTGHMAGHMIAVALAAPLLAFGLSGSAVDPAARWPRPVTPLAMMLVELVVVWVWHLPALRAAAQALMVLALEQLSFLGAGFLLWAAVIHRPQRMAGVGALLLTSMHMTLLGVLIGLAPRPLYSDHVHGLDPLMDQQLGGVVMLLSGAASYFIGGLALLSSQLRQKGAA